MAARSAPKLEPACPWWGVWRGHSKRGIVFHSIADHCVRGQDPRTLHGNWPGVNDAALLCEQRDLSGLDHAVLAPGGGPCEPVDLRGRCITGANVDGRIELFRASSG